MIMYPIFGHAWWGCMANFTENPTPTETQKMTVMFSSLLSTVSFENSKYSALFSSVNLLVKLLFIRWLVLWG